MLTQAELDRFTAQERLEREAQERYVRERVRMARSEALNGAFGAFFGLLAPLLDGLAIAGIGAVVMLAIFG